MPLGLTLCHQAKEIKEKLKPNSQSWIVGVCKCLKSTKNGQQNFSSKKWLPKKISKQPEAIKCSMKN